MAEQRTLSEAQLAQYEKYAALAQLVLGAAHEINNSLGGILSHLELELEAAETGEERAEVMQCIEAAKRISSTVRALLNYAHPAPMQLCGINLERLASETLELVRCQPLFRDKQLENETPPDLPTISADANELFQILISLLLNAAQATPKGGKIRISAGQASHGDQVAIRVSDSGSGIPADVLPRVFEPFFTTKGSEGTGLGLSVTRAYVRSQGGDIQVESTSPRGTTMRVTLPVRQAELPVRQSPEVES